MHPPPQAEIAKLLRFESSKKEAGELISLDDYCERMVEGQDVCARAAGHKKGVRGRAGWPSLRESKEDV